MNQEQQAAKEQEGHEPQQELSSEELMEKARLEELSDQGIEYEEPEEDDSQDSQKPDGSEAGDKAGDTGQDPDPTEPEEGKYPIVHQGKTYYVTPDEYQRMAFKGFDYDRKIGPHQQLINLFQSDQGAQQILKDYLQGRLKPGQAAQSQQTPQQPEPFKAPKLEDYNSEEEWGTALIQAWEAHKQKQEASRAPEPSTAPLNPPPARGQTIGEILRQRDPANYDQVMPQVEQEALQLPMAEYQQLQRDPVKTAEFYDQVKQRLMGGQGAPQGQGLNVPPPPAPGQLPTSKRRPPRPSFRAQSKGGENPQPKKEKSAWDGTDEEHRKFMESIKGNAF
jgi:hypothetical protein